MLCVVQVEDYLSEAHNCAIFYCFAWKRGHLCETENFILLFVRDHSGQSRGKLKTWLFLLFRLITRLSWWNVKVGHNIWVYLLFFWIIGITQWNWKPEHFHLKTWAFLSFLLMSGHHIGKAKDLVHFYISPY